MSMTNRTLTMSQQSKHYCGLQGVAKRLVRELELDNDGSLCVTPKLAARLQRGVEKMQKSGFIFTQKNIGTLTAGDYADVRNKYHTVPGYHTVDKALNEIFDPADLTLCSVHAVGLQRGAVYTPTGR